MIPGPGMNGPEARLGRYRDCSEHKELRKIDGARAKNLKEVSAPVPVTQKGFWGSLLVNENF